VSRLSRARLAPPTLIGEDGLGNIQLGADAPSNAFVALQHEILKLWRRGILLVACSKNDAAPGSTR